MPRRRFSRVLVFTESVQFGMSSIDGIRRTDRLCADLWKTIQRGPEYAGKTTLFILPDFGRDSDDDAGGNGFQHHRDRKSTRLNSSHQIISYAVFCLKKKKKQHTQYPCIIV